MIDQNPEYSTKFEAMHDAFLLWTLLSVENSELFAEVISTFKNRLACTQLEALAGIAILSERLYHKEFDSRVIEEDGESIRRSMRKKIKEGWQIVLLQKTLAEASDDFFNMMELEVRKYINESPSEYGFKERNV